MDCETIDIKGDEYVFYLIKIKNENIPLISAISGIFVCRAPSGNATVLAAIKSNKMYNSAFMLPNGYAKTDSSLSKYSDYWK